MPKYMRHVFTYEVLTVDDTLSDLDLAGIAYEVTNGHASGMFLSEEVEEVSEERMAELLINQGSSPEFLIEIGEEYMDYDEEVESEVS
jgi:hypothetical protein